MITFLSAFSLFTAITAACRDLPSWTVTFFFALSIVLAILAAVL
jgi:hypothetical protein